MSEVAPYQDLYTATLGKKSLKPSLRTTPSVDVVTTEWWGKQSRGQWEKVGLNVPSSAVLGKRSKSESLPAEASAGYQCPKEIFEPNFWGDLPYQSRLFCERDPLKSYISRRSMNFKWFPHLAVSPVAQLNPGDLATQFEKRRIMFVGDSITAQQFYSFICKMGGTLDGVATKAAQRKLLFHPASPPKYLENPYKGQLLERGKQNDVFVTKEGAEFIFVASDFLVSMNETTGSMAVPKSGTYISDKAGMQSQTVEVVLGLSS